MINFIRLKNLIFLHSAQATKVAAASIENNVNYTLAWVTEHYECFIFGSNPDILREMANSIFE